MNEKNIEVAFLNSTKMSFIFEPLMTKVTRFLGREHTCEIISLLAAVSLIYQAIPVVPTVVCF